MKRHEKDAMLLTLPCRTSLIYYSIESISQNQRVRKTSSNFSCSSQSFSVFSYYRRKAINLTDQETMTKVSLNERLGGSIWLSPTTPNHIHSCLRYPEITTKVSSKFIQNLMIHEWFAFTSLSNSFIQIKYWEGWFMFLWRYTSSY